MGTRIRAFAKRVWDQYRSPPEKPARFAVTSWFVGPSVSNQDHLCAQQNDSQISQPK